MCIKIGTEIDQLSSKSPQYSYVLEYSFCGCWTVIGLYHMHIITLNSSSNSTCGLLPINKFVQTKDPR